MALNQADTFWNFTLKAHLELSPFECTKKKSICLFKLTRLSLWLFSNRKVILRCFFLHLDVFVSYFAPLGALQLCCLIMECSSWCSCDMQNKNKQTKAAWVHHHISYKSVRKNIEVAHLFHYTKKPKNQERIREVKILQILSCKLE